MKKFSILLFLLLLLTTGVEAQWETNTFVEELKTDPEFLEATFNAHLSNNNRIFISYTRFVSYTDYSHNVLYSDDGGNTWHQPEGLRPNHFYGFRMAAEADGTIYVVGRRFSTLGEVTVLYKSEDNGETFSILEEDFEDPGDGLISYNGVLYTDEFLSFDEGATWVEYTENLEPEINHLFAYQDYIFAATENGIFRYGIEDNDDNTWEDLNETIEPYWSTPNNNYFFDIIEVADSLIVTSTDGIFSSSDLGETWSFHSVSENGGPGNIPERLIYYDGQFIVGFAGRAGVYRTPDLVTWNEFNEGFPDEFRTTRFLKSGNRLFVKPMLADYLFQIGEGSAVSISDGHSELPNAIQLSQNYPNPFNPSTVISYQLSENSHVQLEVFDMLGRRVALLLNGELRSAGEHSIQFDAKNLPSGTYYYRLSSGHHQLTRKMVLLK